MVRHTVPFWRTKTRTGLSKSEKQKNKSVINKEEKSPVGGSSPGSQNPS
jgi:hypothetical protein